LSQLPILPVFIEPWLADTGHLDHLDRGIYMDLLMLMWRTPNCRVPDDIDWISRKLRLFDEEKVKILKSLINEFCERNAGAIQQKRLLREYDFVQRKRHKNATNAKLRWNKEKSVCDGNANGMQHTLTPYTKYKIVDTIIGRAEPRSPKKGTRLEASWVPSKEGLAMAVEKLGEARAKEEIEKFRDYWTARTGAGATKLDWAATWRNWVRNAKGTNNGTRGLSEKDRYSQVLRSLTGEDSGQDAPLGLPFRPPERR
jgi:uncharacterized protein YdaU (DUF1376 family)